MSPDRSTLLKDCRTQARGRSISTQVGERRESWPWYTAWRVGNGAQLCVRKTAPLSPAWQRRACGDRHSATLSSTMTSRICRNGTAVEGRHTSSQLTSFRSIDLHVAAHRTGKACPRRAADAAAAARLEEEVGLRAHVRVKNHQNLGLGDFRWAGCELPEDDILEAAVEVRALAVDLWTRGWRHAAMPRQRSCRNRQAWKATRASMTAPEHHSHPEKQALRAMRTSPLARVRPLT